MVDLQKALQLYGINGIHPACDLFPMMTEQELAELTQDVKEHGFLHSVKVTSDNLLIDGRNRLVASVLAELDVRVEIFDPVDPIVFVLGENLHRRHLTPGQRAMVALEVERYYAAEAKQRQIEAGAANIERYNKGDDSLVFVTSQKLDTTPAVHAATQAAKAVGVGQQSVSRAKKVAAVDPVLADQVKQGDVSLNKAYAEAQKREQAMPKPEPKITPTTEILQLPTHKGDLIPYPKPKSKPTFNQTNESVGWALWTWNPVTGCNHGCKYCYAREIALNPRFEATYPAGFTPLFHHERLAAPSNTVVPAAVASNPSLGRVFVCSMADLFGAWVPQDWIDQVMAATVAAPDWEYLFLTKFPQRLHRLPLPPKAWIGASIDVASRANHTLDALRKVEGVKVKWLSLEPLLEPLDLDLTGIDWVVIGAQSATNQPDGRVPEFAPDFEWVMAIVAEARRCGTKVWMKENLIGQTNSHNPGMRLLREFPVTESANLTDLFTNS